MNSFYLLLYVPLLGLTALCLVGCWKLVKDRRKHSHDRLWSVGLALLGLAFGTSSLGIVVITHARALTTALLLIMAMNLVGLLRTRTLPNRDKPISDE